MTVAAIRPSDANGPFLSTFQLTNGGPLSLGNVNADCRILEARLPNGTTLEDDTIDGIMNASALDPDQSITSRPCSVDMVGMPGQATILISADLAIDVSFFLWMNPIQQHRSYYFRLTHSTQPPYYYWDPEPMPAESP